MGPEANIYEDLGDNDAEDAGERPAAEGEVLSLLALLAVLVQNLVDNGAEDAGERPAAEGEVLSLLALLVQKYRY